MDTGITRGIGELRRLVVDRQLMATAARDAIAREAGVTRHLCHVRPRCIVVGEGHRLRVVAQELAARSGLRMLVDRALALAHVAVTLQTGVLDHRAYGGFLCRWRRRELRVQDLLAVVILGVARMNSCAKRKIP